MSTQTMVLIRQTASGVWRTAFVFLLSLIIWGLLQPGFLEIYFPIEIRALLERYRAWISFLLMIPVLISAISPACKLLKSPALPGRKILLTLVLMALVIMGVIIPYCTWHNQLKKEARCREEILPMVFESWKQNGGKIEANFSCPCQWEKNLGHYNVVNGKKIIVVDLHAWHPSGRLGLTVDGDVIVLE